MRITLVFSVAATLAAASVCIADDLGQQAYMQYCATCHGADGKGEGPLTQIMTDLPADLTQLSASNDGEFPMLQVVQSIDGRDDPTGHGGPMPVYAAIFADEAGSVSNMGAMLYSRGKIMSIAYYLESIQQ